jgi:outer membrane immunogenic protein
MSRHTLAPLPAATRRAALMASAATVALLAGAGPAAAETPRIWQGMYIGANGAYFASDSENGEYGKWDGEGWGGGVQAGYNHPVSGFFLGAEVDLSLMNVHGRSDPLFEGKTISDLSNRLKTVGSLRLRAGVPIGDLPLIKDALVYGTGGLAIGSSKARYTRTDGGGAIDDVTNNHIGWTAGGGVEVPITENLGVKLEYLHTDQGATIFDLTDGPYTVDTSDDSVRVGINWHLN